MPQLTYSQWFRIITGYADVDPRTLNNYLNGGNVRPSVRERIEAAMVAHPRPRAMSEIEAELLAKVPAEEWEKVPVDLAERVDEHVYGRKS